MSQHMRGILAQYDSVSMGLEADRIGESCPSYLRDNQLLLRTVVLHV
jgi:hypothetical protein